MHICVERDGNLTLVDPDDFKRFHIEVDRELDDEAMSRALAPLGRFDGSDFWVDTDKLQKLAGRANDAEWQKSFRTMLDFARNFGWISPDGKAVKAHVKRT
jgi:hypothetical protein